jgi:hypothetical protein
MTMEDSHLSPTGGPHASPWPNEPVAGDGLDQAIDETMRRYFMRHDPPARAYTSVLEATSRTSTPRYDGTLYSWIIGVSSAVAAMLLVNLVRQLLGATAAQVSADTVARGDALFLVWLSNTEFARWINESESVFGYSGILFLHTFGLAIVVGISTAIDLRLLGAASRMSVTAIRPLFRYMWLGFCVNALSGAMLFAADAPRKAENPLFELKLALVAIGVAVMAVIQRRLLQAESGVSRRDSHSGFRGLAIASLLIWVAAIAAGRLIAYAF